MVGAKGKAFVQGLNQEGHCSHAIEVNHCPIFNVSLLSNTEQKRNISYLSFITLTLTVYKEKWNGENRSRQNN